jgi:pantetheine-phosphate adenylyltransferase
MRVVVGGTFSPLHDGHRALLSYAAAQATELIIGITVNSYVEGKKHPVAPFTERIAAVQEHVKTIAPSLRTVILPLHDPFGNTLEEDYDLLVVSPETIAGAQRINQLRQAQGRRPLPVAEINWVLADDGMPISSTRIWAGEIDQHGHLVTS